MPMIKLNQLIGHSRLTIIRKYNCNNIQVKWTHLSSPAPAQLEWHTQIGYAKGRNIHVLGTNKLLRNTIESLHLFFYSPVLDSGNLTHKK